MRTRCGRIVDGTVQLHQDLRPERLQRVHEVTLATKLRKPGLSVERQVLISIEEEEVLTRIVCSEC